MRLTLLLATLLLGAGQGMSAPGPGDPLPTTAAATIGTQQPTLPGGVGSRVFVVERETESLGVYDLSSRTYLPGIIRDLGDMRHAIMTFSPDLRWGYVTSRSGRLTRVDLQAVKQLGAVAASNNTIDIAISQDGRFVATAEYVPGGVTIMDSQTLAVVKRLPAFTERAGTKYPSRVTGIVDAPGNRFVCVLMEGTEIWVIDASGAEPRIERRVPISKDAPYDAMITPDGRFYVVGHMGSEFVSVLDLESKDMAVREVSLRDPRLSFAKANPVNLPHMAAWAVARDRVFVPLVGEARVVVLDGKTFEFRQSIPVRGHPVYAVASPTQREVWVSFSGENDDAWLQVIDAETLQVKKSIEAGGRVFHLDFTPRGSHVLVAANRDNKVVLVDANTYSIVDQDTANSPSGVYGAWRAFRIGL